MSVVQIHPKAFYAAVAQSGRATEPKGGILAKTPLLKQDTLSLMKVLTKAAMALLLMVVACGPVGPAPLGDAGTSRDVGLTPAPPLVCSTYLDRYMCIQRVNSDGVMLFTNAHTWTSWPQRLLVAVVTVSGCEDQRNSRTIAINRHDWPLVSFVSPPANGVALLETWYQTILTPGCRVDPGSSTIQVELYVTGHGEPSRQDMVVTYRPAS